MRPGDGSRLELPIPRLSGPDPLPLVAAALGVLPVGATAAARHPSSALAKYVFSW